MIASNVNPIDANSTLQQLQMPENKDNLPNQIANPGLDNAQKAATEPKKPSQPVKEVNKKALDEKQKRKQVELELKKWEREQVLCF